MRTAIVLAAIAACVAAPTRELSAQERDTLPGDTARVELGLPRAVAERAAERFNAPATLRATGRLEIPAERSVEGDVAVLDGPLTLGGHVAGSVVVLNGDVVLLPGARVDGGLLVIGGTVEGEREAAVAGGIERWEDRLTYHMEGDRLVADHGASEFGQRMRRLVTRYERSRSRLRLTTDGAYNRVEGLPVLFGPQLRLRTGWGRLRVDAYGILRSADHFTWDGGNVGHDLSAEVQRGSGTGAALGARAFDVVEPVEEWQLRDTEVGLASFFLHRDFRDYYARHGAEGWVRVFRGPAELSLGYGEEEWRARGVRDPFTLFRDDGAWRPNPAMDEGRARVATARLTIDTRNDELDPWTGWLVRADVERGSSRSLRLAPTSPGVREGGVAPPCLPDVACVPPLEAPVTYTRGFLDVRRYNRISTEGQLNLRLVLGGWLGGDPLPLQRRFSVGGAGTLPGYDFRDRSLETDVLTCGSGSGEAVATPDGRPAQCERIALAQVEYRGDLRIGFGGHDADDSRARRWWRRLGFYRAAQWVVFADAGRGWRVTGDDTPLREGKRELPSLRSFRSDVGAGLDFDVIGFYLAKATSDAREPANFFVRLRHRF